MEIKSLQNTHIKEIIKLNNKKARDEAGLFIVEGDHLISEARKNGVIKEVITTDKSILADTYVTLDIMKKISNQKSFANIIAVCKKLEEKKVGKRVLVLDGIQDPGNLGTIIRSAVAFNFTDIVLSKTCVDLYNDKVIRSSEGMIFGINVIRTDIEEFLKTNKEKYQILTTDVNKGKDIRNMVLDDKLIVIIGNEGNGVSDNLKKLADDTVKIEMNTNCESLNAGVSASILMYEITNILGDKK